MSELFISDEEVARKLSNPRNSMVEFRGEHEGKGPSGKFNHLDDETRAVIGAYSRMVGSSYKGADLFGVSQMTALSASKGQVGKEKRADVAERLEEKLAPTRAAALSLIDKVLGLANNDEKLEALSPVQLVNVGSQASGIIKNLTKDDVNINMGKVTFIIEPVKTEQDYEEVDAVIVSDNNVVN